MAKASVTEAEVTAGMMGSVRAEWGLLTVGFYTASVLCRMIDCATGAVDKNIGIAESVWRRVEGGFVARLGEPS